MAISNKITNSNGFKETEIGMIPEDWEVVKLGERAILIMGQSPPGSTYNEVCQGMPFLQGKAEFGELSPKYFKYTTKPLKIAPMGSILISVRAPVGDVNIANIDFCIGRGLASLSLKNGENIFLFYLLKYLKSEIEREGTGSTFKEINKSKLQEFKIPLPPLSEQKKIAAVLSAVQEAKEKTEAVIKATKELKTSLMKHLFTYGPVSPKEAGNVALKETEIGMIPEDWEVVKFENLIIEGKNNVGKIKQSSYKNFGKYPIIDQGKNFIAGFCDDENLVYKGQLPVVIFVDHTRIFKFVDFPFISGADGTKILQPNTNLINPLYFYFALTNLDIPSRGYNRHYPLLREKFLPLPPLSEQQKIAEILSAVDEKIEAEENKKKSLEDLFKTLLNNLMTGKIRVNNLEV